MGNYYTKQIERAEENHDFTYDITIKFFGNKNSSNHLNITKEQLNKIKEIFKNEN